MLELGVEPRTSSLDHHRVRERAIAVLELGDHLGALVTVNVDHENP